MCLCGLWIVLFCLVVYCLVLFCWLVWTVSPISLHRPAVVSQAAGGALACGPPYFVLSCIGLSGQSTPKPLYRPTVVDQVVVVVAGGAMSLCGLVWVVLYYLVYCLFFLY